jgi:hypothetical protein
MLIGQPKFKLPVIFIFDYFFKMSDSNLADCGRENIIFLALVFVEFQSPTVGDVD